MSSLTPVLNSGLYTIRNLAYGPIRDDEGALGAKGNSKGSTELVWAVSRNDDATYTLTSGDPNAPANPGSAISEIERRYYISLESSAQDATRWRLQPVITGSNPPILFAIYQDPRDNPSQTDVIGHWELNNADKKEPVKLNRDTQHEENQDVPKLYTPKALWIFEPQQQ